MNLETLEEFVESLNRSVNIQRKKLLFPIMERIKKESYQSDLVFSGMGEDSAAVMLNNKLDEDLVLITTDAINEAFSNQAPWSAGFSSILVGIEDIYACGGRPIAASVIISSDDPKKRKQLLDGVIAATHKFKTPLVRGHTSDHTKNVSVSATITGTIKKSDYISAGNANPGDKLMILSDFDGKIAETNKMYWDTVTSKSAEEIMHKRKSMNLIAESHLANASKDISNSGLFGTLLLMASYSDIGAVVRLDKLRVPQLLMDQNYSIREFSQMYLTTAFILSVDEKNVDGVLEIADRTNMTAFIIGSVTDSNEIYVAQEDEKVLLWDLRTF